MKRDPSQEFILSPSAVLRVNSVEGLRISFGFRRMKSLDKNSYRSARRGSRRKNCATETTRTRWRRAILIRSRSRLRSSSLVTKYFALPWMAASRISSSSGSRHIFSSPGVSTTVARAAINRTNASASRCGYLNRRINRGRLRTSAISVSWDSDVTALNLSRLQAATTCPGGPEGFRKAETQTLVSSRARSGTAFRLDLGPSSTDFGVDISLRYGSRSRSHSAQQAVKFTTPLGFRAQTNRDARLFPQAKRLKRSKNAVFKDRLKGFFRGNFSFERCHTKDYIDEPTLGSIAMEGHDEENNS